MSEIRRSAGDIGTGSARVGCRSGRGVGHVTCLDGVPTRAFRSMDGRVIRLRGLRDGLAVRRAGFLSERDDAVVHAATSTRGCSATTATAAHWRIVPSLIGCQVVVRVTTSTVDLRDRLILRSHSGRMSMTRMREGEYSTRVGEPCVPRRVRSMQRIRRASSASAGADPNGREGGDWQGVGEDGECRGIGWRGTGEGGRRRASRGEGGGEDGWSMEVKGGEQRGGKGGRHRGGARRGRGERSVGVVSARS